MIQHRFATITQGIGWLFTEKDFRDLAKSLNGEFLSCNISDVFVAYDVVGSDECLWALEQARPAGVRLRHFQDHHQRLAEFQIRLDAAKARRRVNGTILY